MVSLQISTLVFFVRNTSVLGFYCTNMHAVLVCNLFFYLKPLNGSPTCNCLTQTTWKVMQRGSNC